MSDETSTGATRRSFLKTTAALGGGLVVSFFVPEGLKRRAFAQAPPGPKGLPVANAFLRIDKDESVTVLLAHSEMGQGIWTTLPMLVNEELDADWSRFKVEHAPAAPSYGHTVFQMQMTGGSSTTWSEFDRYRQVGAVTRGLLVAAAAERWGVGVAECRTEKGFVISGDKRASYGSLAEDASRLPAPKAVTLKAAKDWKVIGKPTRRLDTPEKITGRATFGLDVQLPGMLTALVAHAPTFGGTVKSFDASAAKAVPGVHSVVQIPAGVAVLGENFWAAKRGRDALVVQWEAGPHPDTDTTKLRESYRALAKTPGLAAKTGGDVAKALGGKPLVAEYSVPYLAHAAMEPLNCTIRRTADGCEVWTGTQFQTGDQGHVAGILGIKPENVAIHTTFLGGGFGRRANPVSDFVVQAAHVAKAVDRPVKLVFTREDDLRGGYYRPLAVHRVEGALDAAGAPVAWRHRIVTQSIFEGTPFEGMIRNGIDDTIVEGASDSPYVTSIPNHQVELHAQKPGVPVLWWRSVGHSHTAFAVESFLDELAHQAKQDPLAFRLALLAKSKAPRLKGVLELAAKKAGWGKPQPKGRALGLAAHESFGSFVAHVADVSVEGSRIKVHKVVCVIDCGICVNPLSTKAQMESAVSFGLGAALLSQVTMKEGRVVESNFHDFRVLRLKEMPEVEVHIVESTEKSGGAGEPGTPPIAPAVANAVFALTGKRLRDLPFRLA